MSVLWAFNGSYVNEIGERRPQVGNPVVVPFPFFLAQTTDDPGQI